MGSLNESTELGEFTHWKSTTAIVLVSRLLFSAPLSLFVNLSIIVTIFKTKSLRRPLNLIHLSLLFLNCLIIIPDVITTCVFIPVVLRYCECDQSTSSVYFTIELLYFIYFPLNFACLGIFQLLILKGRKRLVTYRSTTAAVIACVVITTLVATEGTIVVNLAGQTYVCADICPGYLTRNFDGFAIAFGSYTIICFLPSLIVVALCAMWSCIIFKKNYIGGNDELSRRILSLPIVLPLVLILPTVLSTVTLYLVEQLLTMSSSRPTDYPYWIIFTRFITFQSYEVIARISYPLILLVLHQKIGSSWNALIFTKCKDNQVRPMNASSTYS